MCLSRRGQIARTLLIWTALAAAVLVLAGCVRVVVGHASRAEPLLGQPVEWTLCRAAKAGAKIPGNAWGGRLAVPVDYNHPDGDAATLALIRFPASGDRI